MSLIEWRERPQLNRPVLLAALNGFSDAGDVGTWSLNWLAEQTGAKPLATLDPDGFLVFTEARPQVHLDPAGQRQISWPDYQFTYSRIANGRDLIILSGVEPHLRWKTFTAAVMEIIQETGCDTFVSVGGLTGAVLHSLPATVTGTANTRELEAKLPPSPGSRYQGPTGMLGVLVVEARDRGLATASVWGQVPHYLQARPNIKVAGGVLAQLRKLLDLPIDLREVQEKASQFTAQVNEAIARDPEASEYVRRLGDQLRAQGVNFSQDDPDDAPSSESIIRDLEDFLRRQRPDDRD